VPAWPASPFGLLSHAGPMARTVADLALALEVLSEPDARDWTSPPPAPSGFATERLGDGVRGLRLAFSPDLGHVRVDPDVAALVSAAAETFTALGAHVETVDPGLRDAVDCFEVLWTAGAAGAWRGLGEPGPDVADPGLVALAQRGAGIGLATYQAAMRGRDALGERMSRFHTEWDLLLTPTLPLGAFAAGHDVPPGGPYRDWPDWTPFTYPFNVTQQPAATVPCGFTRDGLPVGLQIVGPRHADGRVLRAAAAYEAAHPQPTVAPAPG
jgi:aspartyl-tRNA(Asn)/glutamyl-tRNA(Gln) amidotransferase subunit A